SRCLQYPLFPVGLSHQPLALVAERVAVGGRQPLALETEERPRDLQEPAVLHGIIKAIHVLQQGPDALPRLDVWRERPLAHAGGVGKLRVIVIAQDVVEAAGRRSSGVDVGMRVDQGNTANLGVETANERIVQHGWRSLCLVASWTGLQGRFYNRLVKITKPSV